MSLSRQEGTEPNCQLGREDAWIGAQAGLLYNRKKSKYVNTDAVW